ncbi:transporter [Acinetobacter rathckeae]|uniref:transporter n=1 Tax=Acinetobacter rathckeae TaxID=2605272 RepID=UPI0018A2DA8C|nr:transporter [Acinetobacter rathckeae]MBF7688243.1 transporter [Acinetobacter rathckeae]MBF7695239.1 transporter [Acinetobacter rathckeae]
MKTVFKMTVICSAFMSIHAFAEDFSFDRPGTGFGTSIAPIGHVAWEQSLPTASYSKPNINNDLQNTVSLQGDMLFRTGLTKNTELQLGFGGPGWIKTTLQGQKVTVHGLGDVTVGVKHAVDLNDNRMTMALLGQVVVATGNDQFTAEDNIYALSSSVQYAQNDILTTGITMRYEMQNRDLAVTAVPTLSYQLSKKWSGYSEFVYRKQESQASQTSLATGVMYAVSPRMQLDASVGAGLSGDVPDYTGGLGVSFLF